LHLAFEARGGRTVLTARRFTLPLQALEPMDLDGDGVATLLLLNPTGGLLAVFVLPGRDILIGVGLMIMMGFLAGVMPALAAMRLRITDALRRV